MYAFKCYQQIAINVSWPHFSWPTLYIVCTVHIDAFFNMTEIC